MMLSLTNALQDSVVPAHLLSEVGAKGLHADLACLLDLEDEGVVLATRAALVGAQINFDLKTSDVVGRPKGEKCGVSVSKSLQ